MRRAPTLLALLAAGCATMEPKLGQPDLAIPPSWPIGDSVLLESETALPAVTYKQVFRDPRLQTLIGRALVNNRNLMAAASNIAAAREQYRIQRAQLFPQLDAGAGVTLTGERTNSGSSSSSSGSSSGSGRQIVANYTAGLSVPSFELDLFGRIRSLTHAQLEQYFATEAGARATRLTLVGDIANAWLTYASDYSLLVIARQTVESTGKSVDLTRQQLRAGIVPRTNLSQATQTMAQAQANLAQQRTAVAQDVNLLQLLVGAPVEARLLPGSIDEAGATIADVPAGVSSTILLRRPDVLQAEYQLRSANADIGAARAALFPKITLTGLLGFASSALTSLFTGGALGFSAGANAAYTIFQAGAGHANVRLTEAQRNAALANYQLAVQTAFREVADALARRATMDEQLAATARQQAAAADVYTLEEQRYRAGIDAYLNLLVAQQSYYSVQQVLVRTKLTAAQNRVDVYQALGGDALLQAAPVCGVRYVGNAGNATLASQCPQL